MIIIIDDAVEMTKEMWEHLGKVKGERVMDMEETTTKNTDIFQAKSRLNRVVQKPVTDYVVIEEGTFLEKLFKTLQDKTSVLEKLKEKK